MDVATVNLMIGGAIGIASSGVTAWIQSRAAQKRQVEDHRQQLAHLKLEQEHSLRRARDERSNDVLDRIEICFSDFLEAVGQAIAPIPPGAADALTRRRDQITLVHASAARMQLHLRDPDVSAAVSVLLEMFPAAHVDVDAQQAVALRSSLRDVAGRLRSELDSRRKAWKQVDANKMPAGQAQAQLPPGGVAG